MGKLPYLLLGETAGELSVFNYDMINIMNRSWITVDQYVLSFVLQGQKEVINADFAAKVDNTKVLLIAEGNYLVTEKGCGSDDFKSILLFFSKEKLAGMLLKRELLGRQVKSTDQSAGYFIVEQDEFVKTFISSLSVNFLLNDNLSRELLEIKFEEIMTYLLYSYSETILTFLLNSLHNDKNLSFRNTIETNKYTNLRAKELAFLCNMSVSTFKRHFAEVYRETPASWFKAKRLERSKQLLESGKSRPSELVDSSGYKNLSHFSTAYKAKFGKNPSQVNKNELFS